MAIDDVVVRVVDQVALAVVAVIGDRGHGSGVLWRPEGLALTCAHVVEGQHKIRVVIQGQAEPLPAEVVGANRAQDVAVLRIYGPFPPPLCLAERPIFPLARRSWRLARRAIWGFATA